MSRGDPRRADRAEVVLQEEAERTRAEGRSVRLALALLAGRRFAEMDCAHGLTGTQFGAKTTRANAMFLARRQTLLAQFLKFGVDDHGILVPMLKRGKGHSVRSHSEYRPLQIPLKNPFRSSLTA